ncbi:probable bacterial lipocalin protein [Rhodococcus aetherivorans]|uniref:Probable bacterial lipocalin protein n=1 Tax=Rhodococcus aetherivorans TaxID=191292 RepID=A0ABQ0YTT2_9NOCA|nr:MULTISPECIES: lipocalin family protein [Rhodococcus]ETT23628.1 Lipocalin/cytosolic fatty-acid binding protein domain containing protein [Rhodococcus rhodochrous ATCC 21198]AKE87963.1 lipocalin [Rhodococcus aetherivorans]ANZ27415.1 lipocalin [Rhodococcus sp. WB1]MBC2590370.1 lipocalin family protein [Rhodococcus aetherivorans]MDV6293399.1 lipocalin family protein [Rhodococcus aetherivorans]
MKRMIRGLAAAVLAAAGAALMAAPAQAAPLTPVAELDVNRYMGTWYQLAANPAPFNLDCVRDTTANYTLLDERNVRVENSCTTVTGERRGIVGNARVNDTASLHVSFPGVPSQDSLDGPSNYIVSYLADDYSWALVGDPTRISGFVLSRSPVVDDAAWQQIRTVVEQQGYNSCLMLTSPTTEGLQEIKPLCTV